MGEPSILRAEPSPGLVARSWTHPMRSRTLANSAVEFMETRPERAFGKEVVEMIGSEVPQYAPEIDQFVAASQFTEQDHFKESEQRLTQFKETLEGFCKVLEERKLDKKLGIEIKKPSDYTMQDVVQVAQDLQTKHQTDLKAKGCLGKIRRCFRRVTEHRGTLHNMLTFLPNDSYGSAICGGFTIALSAIDRAEELRDEMYSALAEVPRQLQQAKDHIEVHKRSPKLKLLADAIFVSIFDLLEAIVKEMSKSFKRKGIAITFKGAEYGTNITATIKALNASITTFQEEARICDSRRLGRIEQNTISTRITIEDSSIKQNKFLERYNNDRLEFAKNANFQNNLLKALPSMIVNQMYRLFASNPNFNSKTGTIDTSSSRKVRAAVSGRKVQKQISSLSGHGQHLSDSVKKRLLLAQKSLQERMGAKLDPVDDVENCLGNLSSLSLVDKDRVRWIMESDEVKAWLASPTSNMLAVEAATAPQDLINPLTMASVLLSKTISNHARLPVLTYLSLFRTLESPDDEESGPIAMMRGLFAQLLQYIAERRPAIDLSFLKKKGYGRRCTKDPTTLMSRFGRLLERLSEDDEGNAVFIIVDSVSNLHGPHDAIADTMLQLTDIVDQTESVVKLLFTHPSSLLLMELDRRGIPLLHVPDNVDGGKQDIDIEALEGDTSLTVEEFRSSQQKSGDEEIFLREDESSELSDDEVMVGE
ncbi:hypothetical protein F5Y15DRAFT_417893 [Xylariaceae sp. FL0016]|nr:hypothetical protein F5Y15DRAFT_417893 [Xylariaceae sp. FL0016]